MSIVDKVRERLGDKIIDWYEHYEKRFYIRIKPEDIKDVVGT